MDISRNIFKKWKISPNFRNCSFHKRKIFPNSRNAVSKNESLKIFRNEKNMKQDIWYFINSKRDHETIFDFCIHSKNKNFPNWGIQETFTIFVYITKMRISKNENLLRKKNSTLPNILEYPKIPPNKIFDIYKNLGGPRNPRNI